MLIILEGADGSGKSTLAKQLEHEGYTVLRHARGQGPDFNSMLDLAISTNKYILDRGIITSWVYRLLDNEQLDETDYNWYQMTTLLTLSKVIFCKTSNDFEFSMQRGEDNITTKYKANKLKDIYKFVVGTIKLYNLSKVLNYDWTKDSIDKVINFIGD